MWYSAYGDAYLSNGDNAYVGQAVSPDGRIWTKEGRVDTATNMEDPFVVQWEDTLWMYISAPKAV